MSLSSTARIVSSKFTLFAIITLSGKSSGSGKDKQVRVPISSLNMRFSANLMSLPMARINIAVGNVMNNGSSAPSNIHAIINQLDPYSVIDVYFSAIGESSYAVPWPAGAHLIWHGNVSATNYSQSPVEFAFSIDSVHWTKNLDRGSLLTRDFTRSNYTDLFARVACEFSDGAQSVSLEGLAGAVHTASLGSVPAQQDLWYQKIFPLMTALMVPTAVSNSSLLAPNQAVYYDTINNVKILNQANVSSAVSKAFLSQYGADASGVGNNLGNIDALAVLTGEPDPKSVADTIITGNYEANAFAYQPISEDSQTNTNITLFFNNKAETVITSKMETKPLIMDTVSPDVMGAVNMAIASHFASSLGQFTALDKLNSCSELFNFALLPNVRTVAVAPALEVFPESRVWRTLNPRDYTMVRGPTAFANILSGVVIKKANPPDSTQENSVNPPTDLNTLLGGVFIGSRLGQLQLMDPPPWLVWKSYGENLTGTTNAPPPTTTPNPIDKSKGKTNAETEGNFLLSGNHYAQTVWAKNNFGYRQMSISMPLRFDIGPGSNIRINGLNVGPTIKDPNIQQTNSLFGYVQGVTVTIDVNSSTAETQLDLSHLRSLSEADLIPDSHPMYTSGNQWYGHPLVRLYPTDLLPGVSTTSDTTTGTGTQTTTNIPTVA